MIKVNLKRQIVKRLTSEKMIKRMTVSFSLKSMENEPICRVWLWRSHIKVSSGEKSDAMLLKKLTMRFS